MPPLHRLCGDLFIDIAIRVGAVGTGVSGADKLPAHVFRAGVAGPHELRALDLLDPASHRDRCNQLLELPHRGGGTGLLTATSAVLELVGDIKAGKPYGTAVDLEGFAIQDASDTLDDRLCICRGGQRWHRQHLTHITRRAVEPRDDRARLGDEQGGATAHGADAEDASEDCAAKCLSDHGKTSVGEDPSVRSGTAPELLEMTAVWGGFPTVRADNAGHTEPGCRSRRASPWVRISPQ